LQLKYDAVYLAPLPSNSVRQKLTVWR